MSPQPTASSHDAALSALLTTSALSAHDRRLVHDALVNSALEGWTPDAQAVALLNSFAAGDIDIDEYQRQVLARAGISQH